MTKREKRYHYLKKVTKYINSKNFAFKKTCLQNLWEFGIAGSNVFLDENGNVQVKALTIDECLDLKNKLPIEGVTIETVK